MSLEEHQPSIPVNETYLRASILAWPDHHYFLIWLTDIIDGFKLSMKLYTFSEAVYKADASIKSISSDVSLTSTVLKELCGIIRNDESGIVSNNALIATSQTVKDCLKIFEELDQELDKSIGEGGMRKRDKVKWPFKEKKMELLRGNLDRLKASLTLMLQVLSYARDVSSQ